MADKKITELTTTISVSDADLVPFVDVSQPVPGLKNQNVRMSVLKAYMASGADYSTRTANEGENVYVRKLVILKNNQLYTFDPTDVSHYGLLVGFLINKGITGKSTYVTSGIYQSEFLSLTPNAIYYSDSAGNLTTVTPAEGIYQEVGFAVSTDKIFINLGQPSLLTEAAVEYTQAEKNKLLELSELRKDPVQSQAVLTSIPQLSLDDKEDRLVENEAGYYRYDAHSDGSEDGAIAPDDQTGGVGFWIPVGFSGNVSADKITETTDRQFVTATEKAKLNLDYGYKDNPTILNNDYPTGVSGAYVRIGSTDTIWVWSTGTNSWVNSDKPITGYVHPDHTGDVTSNSDGQTTISEGAVTFTKINSATKAASGEESATKLVVANDSRLRSKYRGRHLTLTALQTAHSTGLSGDWAEVKPNGGSITEYVWDGGWVVRTGAGLTTEQETIIDSVGDATTLNTTAKILVDAINEVLAAVGGVGALTSEDIDTLAEINSIINDADVASETFVTNITGALASLNTTVKTSLVDSINELITWIKEPKSYAVIKPTGVINYYDDLHSAIAGAVSGDTIEMYNDYVSTSTLIPKDGVTIDTNGHSIINESTSLSSYTLYSDSPNVSWNVIGNGKIIRRGIVSTSNSFAPAVWLTNNSTNNIVNIHADIIHETRQALIVQGEGSFVTVRGYVSGAAQDSQNRTACIVDKATVEIFNDVISKNGEAIGAHVGANVIIHGNLIVESGNGYPVRIGFNNIAESALTVYGHLIRPLGATGGAIYFYNDAEVKIGGAIVNSSGTEAVVHADVVEAKVTFLGPPAYDGVFPPKVTVSYIGTYGGGTGTDHTAEITALQEGKKDKYITVPTSFTPGQCIDQVDGTWELASATVEPFLLVVEEGKAVTSGSNYDLGLPLGVDGKGIYYWNETDQELTLTKPTGEGEVVRVAYKQGTGWGVFVWDNGYIIGGEVGNDPSWLLKPSNFSVSDNNGENIFITWDQLDQRGDSAILRYSTDQSTWTDVDVPISSLGYYLNVLPSTIYYFELQVLSSELEDSEKAILNVEVPGLLSPEPTGDLFRWTYSDSGITDFETPSQITERKTLWLTESAGVNAFNHHPYIVEKDGVVLGMCSTHAYDEEGMGTFVRGFRSADGGATWSFLANIFDPASDSGDRIGGTGRVVIPVEFVEIGGRIIAVADLVEYTSGSRVGIGLIAREIFTDGTMGSVYCIHNSTSQGETLPGISGYEDYPFSEELRIICYSYLDRPGYKPKTNASDPSLSIVSIANNTNGWKGGGNLQEPTDIRPHRYSKIWKLWKNFGRGKKVFNINYGSTFLDSEVPDSGEPDVGAIVTRMYQFNEDTILLSGNSNDGYRRRLYLAITKRRPDDGRYVTTKVFNIDYDANTTQLTPGVYKGGGPQIVDISVRGLDIHMIYVIRKEDVCYKKLTLLQSDLDIAAPEEVSLLLDIDATNLSQFDLTASQINSITSRGLFLSQSTSSKKPTWSSGRINFLDTSNQHVVLTSGMEYFQFQPDQDFTIVLKGLLTSKASNSFGHLIAYRGQSGISNAGWGVLFSNNSIRLNISDGTLNRFSLYIPEDWTTERDFILENIDGVIKIYTEENADVGSIGDNTVDLDIIDYSGQNLVVGTRHINDSTPAQSWLGSCRNIKIYNRALTAQERLNELSS